MDWYKILESLPSLMRKPLMPLLVATVFLALAPHEWLVYLGIGDFVMEFAAPIGLAAVFAVSTGFVFGMRRFARFLSRLRVSRRERKANHRLLMSLSSDERQLLSEMLINDRKTVYEDIGDGVVGGLVATGILFRASSIASHYKTFPFNVQPWVWNMITSEPTLVLSIKDASAWVARRTEKDVLRLAS